MRTYILLLIFIAITISALGQSIYFETRYEFEAFQKELGDGNTVMIEPGLNDREFVEGSFGKGNTIEFGGDYELFDGLHIGLSYNLLFARSTTLINETMQSSTRQYTGKRSYLKTFVALEKAIEKLDVRFSFGLTYDLSASFEADFMNLSTDVRSLREFTGDYSPFGFSAGLEVVFFKIKDFEFSVTSQVIMKSYSPKNSEVTIYTIDGEDQLETLQPFLRYAEYVNNHETIGIVNHAKPIIDLRTNYPFHSIGMGVKVSYLF